MCPHKCGAKMRWCRWQMLDLVGSGGCWFKTQGSLPPTPPPAPYIPGWYAQYLVLWMRLNYLKTQGHFLLLGVGVVQ